MLEIIKSLITAWIRVRKRVREGLVRISHNLKK